MILIALAAVGLVVTPLLRNDRADDATLDEPLAAAGRIVQEDAAAIEREVRRYRAAVRAGTVCARCAQANPAGSRYCYDCGRRIASGQAAIAPGKVTA